ncbi:nicotinate-nucleotide--dimethylbenzimidazole phosphoribosyltransferase [Carboxylicivirga mesophila]|uniref:Nicotinate-nucleotide--dimethylbenzimidazole phosphoribosyltransferase n=1 Tax=Carboxylicivirga mesophila TaxID=1166478 RepID=A0ABS5KEK9_9BACT|nr:nicotinate-nucleotide--dimethylbenzimidazole phosphoribosyltransferase [Carboxylicivirga mesophila]MBS2213227.1 nicotinate-nucleotide--dimethylbenzimidazole phosphoribosyltransferase [Carboxylicivirga mesophila]
MQELQINAVSTELNQAIQQKIDLKTKPLGALGMLEKIAFKVCQIQQTTAPQLSKPAILVCAGDHGITQEKVSPFPQEVTFQMVMNFLGGGAAINVFCRQNNIQLLVADTGVNFDFEANEQLLDLKVRKGTRNFAVEPAMTREECQTAMMNGAKVIEQLHLEGTNIVGFGEMGIGNTTAATALLCKYAGISANEASGAGTGLDAEGILHKASVIDKALQLHAEISHPLDILTTFGGYEIATICGAILKAAELKMVILSDGFIATSALIAAHAINPNVTDYCLFAHESNEQGHKLMLKHLKAEPILHLGLRLGEGTGSAVAYPLVQSAVCFMNEMSSFEDAGVSNKE